MESNSNRSLERGIVVIEHVILESDAVNTGVEQLSIVPNIEDDFLPLTKGEGLTIYHGAGELV